MPKPAKARKILILEDDSPIAELIKDFCSLAGHSVRLADDGDQVLDAVREFKPDLILLDLVMPRVSGIEVIEILKQDEAAKDIPIIVISSIANNVAPEGILKECKAILAKPIDFQLLQSNIESVLPASR